MIQSTKTELNSLKNARDRIMLKRTELENDEYYKELIASLEKTQKEWQETIQELKQQKEKYNELIDEIKKIKQIIVNDALKSNMRNSNKLKIRILSVKKY